MQLIKYTTIGLRIPGYGAAEVFIVLRKSSDIRKPIRCVPFTKAVVRHANIRDQNTSLGMICPGDPHQRNSNAQNLRMGPKKRRNAKSDVPVKQRGGWPKIS